MATECFSSHPLLQVALKIVRKLSNLDLKQRYDFRSVYLLMQETDINSWTGNYRTIFNNFGKLPIFEYLRFCPIANGRVIYSLTDRFGLNLLLSIFITDAELIAKLLIV